MHRPMKVAFAGTPEFAAEALRAILAAGFEVPLVLTQPDRPAGRGMKLQASPVKQLALAHGPHGIAVAQPHSLRLDGKYPDEAAAARPEFVVLTGGEPCIHDLTALLAAMASVGLKVHLETCGAYPIAAGFAWVTVSPKWAKPPLADALARADEVKLIVEAPDSITRWTDAVGGKWLSPNVWLHPEWSRRADSAVLRTITEQVKQGGAPYRAGWQVHKPYSADSLDARARPPAPLGGDVAKGF